MIGHIGGMTTSGLSYTDFRTFEGITGTFLYFSRRVEAYYRDRDGDDNEFTDNGHLPWQLYVCEARRMVGQYIFTEGDTDAAPNDARSVFRSDAIEPTVDHGNPHEASPARWREADDAWAVF